MYLLRLSVSKEACAMRDAVTCVLQATPGMTETLIDTAMPSVRGHTDAVRVAASYALQRWQRFTHAGKVCKAIATQTTGSNKRGLDLHIHVRTCDATQVRYSALVGKLTASRTSAVPTLDVADDGALFPELLRDLDPDILVHQGQTRCYENDLRRLCQNILEPHGVSLWPGVWLVLTEDGVAFARALERALAPTLDAGTLTLSLIALEMTQANREALARELAEEFTRQFDALTARTQFVAPQLAAITRDYAALVAKLAQAEALLDTEIPCLDALTTLEAALMDLETIAETTTD